MDINAATPIAAFAAGLATSLHCAAMCGPLACAVRAKPAPYHLSRFVSYSIAGAVCGAVGESASALLHSDLARVAPWLLAAVLIAFAFGLEKKLPQPRWLAAIALRARLRGTLGFFTPLLPCGPLWLMLGVAITTGSMLGGLTLMGSFALGTIPLYALAQIGWGSLQARFSAAALRRSQQLLSLSASALLVWRATFAIHGACH